MLIALAAKNTTQIVFSGNKIPTGTIGRAYQDHWDLELMMPTHMAALFSRLNSLCPSGN
jgi:hypothetical protein